MIRKKGDFGWMRTNASDFRLLEKLERVLSVPKARVVALVRHPQTLSMEPAVELTSPSDRVRRKSAIFRLKILTYRPPPL